MEPRAARRRKSFLECALDALGPRALFGQAFRAASAAGFREQPLEIEIMTTQPRPAAFVQGERDCAARTFGDLPACLAQNARRKAAPVQEQNRLLAANQSLLERAEQWERYQL